VGQVEEHVGILEKVGLLEHRVKDTVAEMEVVLEMVQLAAGEEVLLLQEVMAE
jgi:hypothetical protein